MNGALAIQYLLANNAGFNSLVGTNSRDARIAYVELDQKTVTPCCVITGDSVEPTDTKDGVSTLDFDHVYVTHFASTYKEVAALASAARAALDRKSGTYNGVTVVSIRYMDERDSSEFLVDGKKVTKEQLYQVMTTN